MLDISNHPIWKNVSPLKKRGHLARLFLARQYAKMIPPEKIIGVVGAVGKTTTMLACKEVLSEKYSVVSTTDTNTQTTNLDPIFNLPMTLLRVRPKTDKVMLEMGIEYPGEMDFYLDMVTPKTAIVTRLSFEHNQFLGSLEDVIKEEGRIIERLPEDGVAILNYDDLNTRKLANFIKPSQQVVFFGTDQKNCHIWAENIKISNFKTSFQLNSGVERAEINSKLLGKHMIYPMLGAAALGVSLNMNLTTIKKGLEKVEPAKNRLQAKLGINDSIILDDTYNAAPKAVEEALETLNLVQARRRILVLGEMRELGQYSEDQHRLMARKIFKDRIDLVFLGPGEAQYIEDELKQLGFPEDRLEAGLTNDQMVKALSDLIRKGDVVLVKGANSLKLNEVVDRLVKKIKN